MNSRAFAAALLRPRGPMTGDEHLHRQCDAEAAKILEARRSVGSDQAVVLLDGDEGGRSNDTAVACAFSETGLTRPKGGRPAALPAWLLAPVRVQPMICNCTDAAV
jgi:hypothetical protein